MEIRELPAVEKRVETGPTRFGDDWPGVFIRGDTAIWDAHRLETALRFIEKARSEVMAANRLDRNWKYEYYVTDIIKRVIGLLKSCDMRKDDDDVPEEHVPGETEAQDNTGAQGSIQSGVRTPEPTGQTTEFHTDQPTG